MTRRNRPYDGGAKRFFPTAKLLAGAFVVSLALFATALPARAAEVLRSGTGSGDSSQTWTLYSDGVLQLTGSGAWTGGERLGKFYKNADDVKYVKVGEGITAITGGSWSDFENLQTVELSSTVTSIGKRVFDDCYALTSVTGGTNLQSIGDYAFESCKKLTTITIGDSLQSIGNDAFAWCAALPSFAMPDTVQTLGEAAFAGCESLSKVTLSKGLTKISKCAFQETNLKSVTIPSGVTEIGKWAFTSCPQLSEVSLPDTLTTVDDYAFSSCPKLTSVTIPKSVTSIGEDAFGTYYSETSSEKGYGAYSGFTIYGYKGTAAETYAKKYSGFTFVDISALSVGKKVKDTKTGGVYKVTKAGQEVAYQKPVSKKKTSVTIPATIKVNGVTLKVTSVAKKAFYKNKKLKKVTIGANVKTIGASAFAGCTSLKTVIAKSKVLTTIGKKAFSGDKKLASVTLKTKKLKKVGAQAFRKIKSNAVIRVPKSCKKTYKKLLSGKGQGKNVKIKAL